MAITQLKVQGVEPKTNGFHVFNEKRDEFGCLLDSKGRYTRINQVMRRVRVPRTKKEILTDAGMTMENEGGHFTWLVKKGYAVKLDDERFVLA